MVNQYHKQSTSIQLIVHDINFAEMVIVKHAQRTYYDEDLQEIQTTGRVSKSSSIYKLSPTTNKDGILVVQGRMSYAPVPERAKHPYTIPSKHILADLIIPYGSPPWL